MIGALEVGLIYGVMALGVYLTFRVLNFPDLTVDGSFTTGAAVAATAILAGWNPIVATLAGFGAGFVAGLVTGLLHTKGKIDGLLAGILTMIALWSVNLRIMDGANVPLLRAQTMFTPLKDAGIKGSPVSIAIFALVVILLALVVWWFLNTDLGLSIRATGDNGPMITSFGVSTDFTKTLTLGLSNGLVGMCGALIAQYQGFADISMGIGLILVGLASVIMGQAIFGQRFLLLAIVAVIVGSVLYRIIIFCALQVGLDPNDMKAITAVLVIVALVVPRWRGALSAFTKKTASAKAGA
ncbi:ABC transporter permease [Corynebacterium sp. 320]|uniref:ABC transporter permease n=1 Tax=Corynebacterium TaxID=1716 RepID=UPI00125CB1E0|nr:MULTISPECIES: ABC transporter permease [Corynebacterium]KAB1503587.1 ABC transporter permease [Corynebacterium sp. 320]KAB1553312.1 ABC transporter permease [Corynebacterium sp. 321]KAB1553470.1 ABC transporter permease [Corynebacterium sp. 319]KAB3527723.1 ABC transporter permease [Corynebacterium sp. 250]KAB3540786.1 ABC transporter permease [Corynebacterium sp. 366]